MKTNTFVTIALLVLVVVYILVLQIKPEHYENKSKFVPDTTIVYFEQKNSIRSLRKISRSSIDLSSNKIDFVKVARKLEFEEKQVDTIERAIDFYHKILTDEIVDEFFSKSFAFALDSTEDVAQATSLETYVRLNSVVIAEPKHSAGFLTFIAETYSRFTNKFELTVKQYGTHNIHRITFDNEQLSIVVVDGLLVASLNEALLKKCIDTYDGDERSLNSSPDFTAVQNHYLESENFLYLAVDLARSFITRVVEEQKFTGKDLVKKELATTKGFTGVGYGMWFDNSVLTERIAAHYKKDLVNDITGSILEIPSTRSSMLKMTSLDPVAFYWSNTFDLYRILPYLLQEEKVSAQLKNFAQKTREQTGKSMTEILSWLGEEISIVIESGSSKTFLAVPIIATFLQIKDVEKLKTTISDISRKSDLIMTQKEYKGATYHYLSTSTQEGLQILYGFHKEFLFLSNSADFIRRIMDNIESGKRLDQINKIAAIDPGVTAYNNSITYSNNIVLIDMIKRFLNFASTMIAMEDRDLAFRSKIVVTDLINPFLEGLKMYTRSCTRSYFTSDFILIDSVTQTMPATDN